MSIKFLAQTKLRAALFAGGLLSLAAPAAFAVPIIVTPASPIPVTNDINGLYLNVITGASGSASAPTGWDINVYNNGAGLTFFTNSTTSAYVGSPVTKLTAPFTVGPSSTFSLSGQISGSNFQTAGTGYFGFRFVNEATGLTHYGYAQLSTGATAGFPASLISYGYESVAGTAITVVPEPSTYALMALGLAGIGGLSRLNRRKQA